MLTTKKEQSEIQIEVSITCDCCKKTYDKENDMWEFQEFLRIRYDCGFGSTIGDGDGSMYECHLCQHCVEKILLPHFRKIGDYIEGGSYENPELLK